MAGKRHKALGTHVGHRKMPEPIRLDSPFTVPQPPEDFTPIERATWFAVWSSNYLIAMRPSVDVVVPLVKAIVAGDVDAATIAYRAIARY
jgi:hypothetical protein